MEIPIFLPRTKQTTQTFSPIIKLVTLIICLVLLSCAKKEDDIKFEEFEPYIDLLRIRAQEIASTLDDRLLIAQLLISGIDGREKLSQNSIEMLTDLPTGGIMLFRYNLNTDSATIKYLLEQVSSLILGESGIFPFIAVDHEGGTVNRLPAGLASLPSPSSYLELALEKEDDDSQIKHHAGIITEIFDDSLKAGLELSALGINMNFAPVAECLTDENKTFLAKRSYGPNPGFTAEAVCAFINGMGLAGVVCVVKHFPGSAGNDPHFSASVLNIEKEAADELIYPFKNAKKYGARAIMAAHTVIPSIDKEIASLSSVIMSDWLRGDLGFSGIIISDDFTMAAAGKIKPEEAAVRSVAAGSDMILVWPAHLKLTHEAFISALEDGRLSRERLLDAATRVIYEKLRMGLAE